jgi:dinuclear metal center YbgI/SA1388 family protein
MPVARDDLLRFLDEYLDTPKMQDYGPNGLQVPGAREIQRVALGVDASLAFLQRAAAWGAQAALVHHGLFWQRGPLGITERLKARLKVLFDHDMNLIAYHLPLDRHPEVGNNAELVRLLGLQRSEQPFGAHAGTYLGAIGIADPPLPLEVLVARLVQTLHNRPLIMPYGPDPLHRIGIVSGAGAAHLDEAIGAGLDAFLTGEPSEPSQEIAREAGITFIAAGHYATETVGVQALGRVLEDRFNLECCFFDVPNPV